MRDNKAGGIWLILILCVLTTLPFVLWPQLDLLISGWFYDPAQGFFWDESFPVQVVYQLFDTLHLWLLALMLIGLGLTWTRYRRYALLDRRQLGFLFLLMLIGPGLITNALIKEYSGRARPRNVVEFGGDHTFTPALTPAAECADNCSYVSGHAALGFWFIGLGWVLRRRRYFALGIVVGLVVGAGRIIQGGHFTSDVIGAFWVVFFTAFLLARWLLPAERTSEAPAAATVQPPAVH